VSVGKERVLVSEGRTRVVPIVAEQSRIDGGFARRIKPLTPRRQAHEKA
jgi:hypothetical protein